MRKRSLKNTILITFILISSISCVTLFFIAVRFSRFAIRAMARDDVTVIADRINDTVGELINEKFNYMEYFASLTSIKDPDVPQLQKQAILNPIAHDKSKDLISLSYINKDGEAYVGSNMKMNFSSAPIVQSVMKNKKTMMVGPTRDNISNELTINIGTPVIGGDNSFQGLILARLDCKFLCEVASRISIGKTGYAVFVDRATGNTIGSKNLDDVKEGQNLLTVAKETGNVEMESVMNNLMAGETGWSYVPLEGLKKTMIYRPLTNTNWSVVIVINEKEFLTELKGMETRSFISTIVLLIFSIVAAIVIVRNLNPLKTVAGAISEIATGNADLTQRLTIKHTTSEINDIVKGFNDFVTKMHQIVSSMKNSEMKLSNADESLQAGTHDTSSAITEIIANIESVNSQILNQVSSVNETAGAVNQIASNIESLETMIIHQASGVEQASSAVEEMVGNINAVNSSVDKMFQSFKTLEDNAKNGINLQNNVNEKIRTIEEQSKMLQDANQAIANIASQTNLLAMNAAIESAHAGDAGKGFAVVADEIRKLSETSTEQSNTIGTELKKIQESINTVVSASTESASAFNSVADNIKSTDEIVRQIKGAMEEQIIGSRQITDALHSMNDSTSEVRSASREMAEGNKHILSEIQNLQNTTSVMKDSIEEMSIGAQRINDTGAALTDVSNQVTESIDGIKNEIALFKI